jgi:hypothetical protein
MLCQQEKGFLFLFPRRVIGLERHRFNGLWGRSKDGGHEERIAGRRVLALEVQATSCCLFLAQLESLALVQRER